MNTKVPTLNQSNSSSRISSRLACCWSTVWGLCSGMVSPLVVSMILGSMLSIPPWPSNSTISSASSTAILPRTTLISSSWPRSRALCKPGGKASKIFRACWTSGSSELGGGTAI